ncbi:PKD-like family lipoprotein [Pedobacter nyackensis]|uniref:PKD-like family lipoprotein n=1 Tax=Pedobacter nyackensis TaxID=475255 RepID=UPI0029306615|nr:PKD-like family lipoprotein [Pedobacter nyackensis]
MKRYFLGLICLLYAVVLSCSKDKGNYDLTPINEIKIEAKVKDTITVFQFETLQITPTLQQTIEQDERKLTYQWSIYQYPNSSGNKAVLGHEKNLNAAINVNPGKYTILYTVKDSETGVSFFKEFYTEVNTKLSEGWLALENQPGGKQDLAIINSSEEVIHELYKGANAGELLPAGSYAIRVLNTYLGRQSMFVLAKNNGVEVDYVSLKKFNELNSWFFVPPTVINLENYFYNKFGVAGYIVNDGELYSLSFANQGPEKFGAPIKGDYKISKFAMPLTNNDFTILYDTKNQRFLNHAAAKITTFSSPAGSAFDLNNVGKQLIYSGVSIGEYYNCIMKNNTDDQYYVYRINTTGAIIAAEKYDIEDAPFLNNANLFTSSGLYLHIYYAVNNKIYLLDIPAKKARLVYTFPTGAEITALELKQAQSILISYPDNNKQLAVATFENNEGKIYKFSISNTGDFVNGTFSKEYRGFNKVIDLEYKNRK